MEILKKRLSWLTERNLLILLLFLITGFGAHILSNVSQSIRTIFLLPWALGMAYCALRKREIPGTAPLFWNCACMAAYAVSGILNRSMNISWIHGLWLFALCAFFLAALPRKTTARRQHTELLSVGTLFVTCFLPFALLTMVSVFTARNFNIPGLEKPLGVMTNGDAGSRVIVFFHPNTTARFALFNILFCIYALCRVHRRSARVYFALNILLNAMVLAHTQSRTCFIALAAGMAAIAFRGFFLLPAVKRWRVIAAIAAAALAFMLTLGLLNGLYKADVLLAQNTTAKAAVPAVQTRAEVEGQFDVFSNGRDDIWLSAIYYLRDNPKYLITGMGGGDLVPRIAESYPAIAPHHDLHNTYLNVLARYGVGYAICVLGFLCAMVPPVLRVLFAPSDRKNRGMFVFPVMIGVMLIMSIPEEMLFAGAGWANLLFYFVCGHVLHADRLLKAKNALPEENV